MVQLLHRGGLRYGASTGGEQGQIPAEIDHRGILAHGVPVLLAGDNAASTGDDLSGLPGQLAQDPMLPDPEALLALPGKEVRNGAAGLCLHLLVYVGQGPAQALRQELARRGYFLSSANSINWGRVLPQIVYYISAYCDLLRDGRLELGDPVNVCVPTGNFGNILAAYYARDMGVPIQKLICASNSNNVLTDFIRTGRYDRNRAFHNTISPSMDILISSNLERLLLALTQDDEQVKDYMAQLSATGTYQVSDRVREKLQKRFAGYFCDDAETKAVIGRIYQKYDYLIDPHTAVAFDALEQYRSETGDQTPCIVVSTASPFKFCDSVLSALGEEEKQNGLELLDELSEKTGMPAPKPLSSLRDKEIRFTQTVEKDHMVDAVLGMLE